MKKIASITLLMALIIIAGTGCLKDKGYDNNEYGINDPNNSPAGVGFIQGIRYKTTVGLNLSPDPQTISNELTIALLSGKPAQADITVKLELDPAIVTDYNAQFGTSILPLDPSLYSLPSLDVVIPAGQKLGNAVLNVPSTISLDPNETYGLGFKIVNAGGFVIASNENRVLLEIGLKNKYDGIYGLFGYHNRPPATTYGFPYTNVEMHMVTSGPSDVVFYWPLVDDFGHPIGVGPNNSLSWYGPVIQPVIRFDPVTNVVTDVYNYNPGGGVTLTLYTGPIPTNNYYDPATKKIYVAWQYNNNPDRAFFDTLVFRSER